MVYFSSSVTVRISNEMCKILLGIVNIALAKAADQLGNLSNV